MRSYTILVALAVACLAVATADAAPFPKETVASNTPGISTPKTLGKPAPKVTGNSSSKPTSSSSPKTVTKGPLVKPKSPSAVPATQRAPLTRGQSSADSASPSEPASPSKPAWAKSLRTVNSMAKTHGLGTAPTGSPKLAKETVEQDRTGMKNRGGIFKGPLAGLTDETLMNKRLNLREIPKTADFTPIKAPNGPNAANQMLSNLRSKLKPVSKTEDSTPTKAPNALPKKKDSTPVKALNDIPEEMTEDPDTTGEDVSSNADEEEEEKKETGKKEVGQLVTADGDEDEASTEAGDDEAEAEVE